MVKDTEDPRDPKYGVGYRTSRRVWIVDPNGVTTVITVEQHKEMTGQKDYEFKREDYYLHSPVNPDRYGRCWAKGVLSMNGASGRFLGKQNNREPKGSLIQRLQTLRQIAGGLRGVETISWRGNRLIGMANGTPFTVGF